MELGDRKCYLELSSANHKLQTVSKFEEYFFGSENVIETYFKE